MKIGSPKARDAEGRLAPRPAAAVRLRGTLGSDWRLDVLDLAVGARTAIDEARRAGDYVEARGRLDEAGNVEIEWLKRR